MVEVSAGERIETAGFSETEQKRLKSFWDLKSKLYGPEAVMQWWPERYRGLFVESHGFYKKNEGLPEYFGENAIAGYGTRGILTYDVVGGGSANSEWGTNWGTEGRRSWLGGSSFDTAIASGSRMWLRGVTTTDMHWYVTIIGVVDAHPSPGRINAIESNLDGTTQAVRETETDWRFNPMQVTYFQNPFLLTDRKQSRLSVHVETTGNSDLIPIGWVTLDNRRSKLDPSNLERPTSGSTP